LILPDGNIVIRLSIITNGKWSFNQIIFSKGCELTRQDKYVVCPGRSIISVGCFSNSDKPVELLLVNK